MPLKNSDDVVKVHKGFQEQYESLRETVRNKSAKLLIQFSPPEIVITGHSLGGALATLCGLDLTLKPISLPTVPIKVVTFGSPKVGDGEFVKLFNRSVVNCFRLRVKYDPFPQLPPSLPGLRYEHVGQDVILKEPDEDDIIDLTPIGKSCNS